MVDSVVLSQTTPLATYIGNYCATQLSINNTNLINTIITAINNYITNQGNGIDVPLSAVSVDYETNKANLESILYANPVWLDTSVAETGQMLLSLAATVLTYLQMAIIRAAQENMSTTMRIPSSMLMGARFLGVRVSRAIPALHVGNVTRSGSLTSSLDIPAYTQFSSSNDNNSYLLFNRTDIVFPANVATVPVNFYEGQVGNVATFISNGTANQYFILGQNDYSISDVDVVCTINGVTWQSTEYFEYFSLGLWEYGPTDLIYSQETTGEGNVEILFGNGNYGAIPNNGSQIAISYVITSGASGNVDLTSSALSAINYSNITGTITATGVNGADALDPTEYKTLAPAKYAAKYRAVTRQDHAALARSYPGVIDAIFEGQAELAPTDLRQMLISRCTLLTNSAWTTNDFDTFSIWFQNLDMAGMQIYQNTPSPVTMNVIANVYCFDSASLTTIQNQIIANIQNAFVLQAGILGLMRTVSDIGNLIMNSNRVLIDYYDIVAPTNDITVTAEQYVVLGTVTINTYYTTRLGV